MRSLQIAEWVLTKLTDPKNASTTVGDLMELQPHKGSLWLWLSLARIILTLVWRQPTAFITACFTGPWSLYGFDMAIHGIHAKHHPSIYPWNPILVVFSAIGSCLWILLPYTSIRYGLRDKVTQLTLALTTSITLALCFWWQPLILAFCLVWTLCVASLFIISKVRRQAAMVLFGTLFASFAGGLLAMFMASRYQMLVHPGLMGDRELREYPSVQWVGLCMWLITVWITTMTYGRLRRRVFTPTGFHEGEIRTAI